MTRNGNAITLAKRFTTKAYTLADSEMLHNTPQGQHMGMVHPSSMHNLLPALLASGGIDPDRDVSLKTIPQPRVVVDLQAGSIDGYRVGELNL